MNPRITTPARSLTRLECRMHELMADLVAANNHVAAARCRRDLARVSARRALVAAAEARGESEAA